MVDGVDLVDDVDTENTHPRGCVHSVHNVHSVHCLDKPVWFQLPDLGLGNRVQEISATRSLPLRSLRLCERIRRSRGDAKIAKEKDAEKLRSEVALRLFQCRLRLTNHVGGRDHVSRPKHYPGKTR